ncbi:MAG: DJ-1/PfpI family protein, partial [bacterium]
IKESKKIKLIMERAVLRLNRSPHSRHHIENQDQNETNMVKKALVFLIDGNEESELITTVDALRRADVECLIAGVHGNHPVTCVQHVRIIPDLELNRCENEIFDAVIVPGGPGSERFHEFEIVGRI